jgi:hypothetical protein
MYQRLIFLAKKMKQQLISLGDEDEPITQKS